ncbi:hypothetical protein DFH06DRAFT_1121179 [Mycena polygramma]|nr:hypothetical protein DFH06DRAFT_1121179 [Mycena polygramma]
MQSLNHSGLLQGVSDARRSLQKKIKRVDLTTEKTQAQRRTNRNQVGINSKLIQRVYRRHQEVTDLWLAGSELAASCNVRNLAMSFELRPDHDPTIKWRDSIWQRDQMLLVQGTINDKIVRSRSKNQAVKNGQESFKFCSRPPGPDFKLQVSSTQALNPRLSTRSTRTTPSPPLSVSLSPAPLLGRVLRVSPTDYQWCSAVRAAVPPDIRSIF